jgi:hypothetical protein
MFSINQLYGYASNLIFAYVILVGFILSLGLDVENNHKQFISHPVILIISSFFFVSKSIGNTTITITAIILFYLSTLYIANNRLMYKKLLGDTLGELCIDMAEELGVLEEEPIDMDEELRVLQEESMDMAEESINIADELGVKLMNIIKN